MEEATAQAVPLGLISAHTSATLMGVKTPSLMTEQKNRRTVNHTLITMTTHELFSKLSLVDLAPVS